MYNYRNQLFIHNRYKHNKSNSNCNLIRTRYGLLMLDNNFDILFDEQNNFTNSIYLYIPKCQLFGTNENTQSVYENCLLQELKTYYSSRNVNVNYCIQNDNIFKHSDKDIVIYMINDNYFRRIMKNSIEMNDLTNYFKNEEVYLDKHNLNNKYVHEIAQIIINYVDKQLENIKCSCISNINYNLEVIYRRYIHSVHLEDVSNSINGFIEMNCNPMTKGHEYLIKTAYNFMKHISPFSRLIIAICKDDSKVSNTVNFNTRIKIVQKVCERIENEQNGCSFYNTKEIRVVSNENVLIGDIFNGYTKTNKSFDGGENAMKVFSKILAPMLNIKYRFFGTENHDIITNKYNECAMKICPKNDIKVVIVNRLTRNEI